MAMGRPEGPGCYCYANNVLRDIMGKLIKDYQYIVIDNEAGLEHLSRRTTRCADALVVVSDATIVGLRSAKRINDLAKELDIKIKKRLLVVNKPAGKVDEQIVKEMRLQYIGNVPMDDNITKVSMNGGSVLELDSDTISLKALRKIGEGIWQRN